MHPRGASTCAYPGFLPCRAIQHVADDGEPGARELESVWAGNRSGRHQQLFADRPTCRVYLSRSWHVQRDSLRSHESERRGGWICARAGLSRPGDQPFDERRRWFCRGYGAGNERALTIRNLAVGYAATETACALFPAAL